MLFSVQCSRPIDLLEGRQPVNRGRCLGKGWLGGLRAFTMMRVIDKDGGQENCYNGITWTTTEDEVELETAGSPPWAGSSITCAHC